MNEWSQLYTVNEEYFDEPLDETKAYWLGFIAADGSVRKDKNLTIELNVKDLEHLEQFRRDIGATTPVKIRSNGNMAYLRLSRKRIVDSLAKYNIVPNKTLQFEPINIPDEHMRHFIRGYFDGDGSVFNDKGNLRVNIVGNKRTLEVIDSYIQTNCDIAARTIHSFRHTDCKYIKWSGNRMVSKIYNYLYEGTDLCLERKRRTFQNPQ